MNNGHYCHICKRCFIDEEDYVFNSTPCDFCDMDVCNTCNTEHHFYSWTDCYNCTRYICDTCKKKRNCFHNNLCGLCRRERQNERENEFFLKVLNENQ